MARPHKVKPATEAGKQYELAMRDADGTGVQIVPLPRAVYFKLKRQRAALRGIKLATGQAHGPPRAA